MLQSNPHVLSFSIVNVTPGKPSRTTFTKVYVKQHDITVDFPCCTRYTDLTRTPPKSVNVLMSRFHFKPCPVHS